MAVVLRIKFPPTYPVIHKVLRIDKELTVVEAIDFIREAVRVPPSSSENVGIFIPHENLWLEDEVKLKEYPSLEDAVSCFEIISGHYL